MSSYINVEELKEHYLGVWDDENDSWADKQLENASAYLRAEFKEHGRDLNEEIEDEEVEESIVKSVVASMVLRKLSSESLPYGGAFAQISEAADGYSHSITPVSRFSNLYVRRDEKKLLGIPLIAMGTIDIVL